MKSKLHLHENLITSFILENQKAHVTVAHLPAVEFVPKACDVREVLSKVTLTVLPVVDERVARLTWHVYVGGLVKLVFWPCSWNHCCSSTCLTCT